MVLIVGEVWITFSALLIILLIFLYTYFYLEQPQQRLFFDCILRSSLLFYAAISFKVRFSSMFSIEIVISLSRSSIPISLISYGIVSLMQVFVVSINFCAFRQALLYLSLWYLIAYFNALFCITFFSIFRPVIGLLSFYLNHFSITYRQKLYPSMVITGSCISSRLMGQKYSCGEFYSSIWLGN